MNGFNFIFENKHSFPLRMTFKITNEQTKNNSSMYLPLNSCFMLLDLQKYGYHSCEVYIEGVSLVAKLFIDCPFSKTIIAL